MQSPALSGDLELHLAGRARTVADNENKLAQLFGADTGLKCVIWSNRKILPMFFSKEILPIQL
jgi:hypothetical protein